MVGGAGLIYAVIIGMWALVLVPMWLRRHDEAQESKSADRFARAMGTLRRGGRLHHIKLGTALAGTPVRMLVHDLHVIVIDRATGEILRELDIDPTKDSQPRGVKPGPRPGHRRGGMPKGYKFPT